MAILPSPLKSPVKPQAVAPKKEEEPKKPKREHLGSGDYLIETLENEAKNHHVQLIERTDSSQLIRFYMKCSCGTEARMHTEKQIREQAEYHLARHPR